MDYRTCPKCSESKPSPEWAKGQSYCRPCFRSYKRERLLAKVAASPERYCTECEAAFRSAYVHTVTCSAKCGRKRDMRLRGATYAVADLEPAECARCGEGFGPKSPTNRFCSLDCKESTRFLRRRVDPEYHAARSRWRAMRRAAVTFPFTGEQFASKLAYWGNACWMCGADACSLDHVKPVSKGGPHMLANFRPACRSCNSSKGAKWFGPSELSRFVRN